MTIDLQRHRANHTKAAIAQRLNQPHDSYLKDFVLGAIDGTVTTFAVIAGVSGATLGINVVLILGTANLLADGFSMAVGNFLACRSENQLREKKRHEELEHIRVFPEGEREEIRQILAHKGYQGQELEDMVQAISHNTDQWVETMLIEEHGLTPQDSHPVKAGLVTFLAFFAIGAIPLLPFIWNSFGPAPLAAPFFLSICLAALCFFLIGAVKSRFVEQNWVASGTETFLIGNCAAGIAYAVGLLLKKYDNLTTCGVSL